MITLFRVEHQQFLILDCKIRMLVENRMLVPSDLEKGPSNLGHNVDGIVVVGWLGSIVVVAG